MAYDQALAARVEAVLAELNPPNLENEKMFGGVGYLVRGNIACGIRKDKLVVRVGKDAYQDALGQPGADVFDITGRPMTRLGLTGSRCSKSVCGPARLGGKGAGFHADPAGKITSRFSPGSRIRLK